MNYLYKPWNSAAMFSQDAAPSSAWNHVRKVYYMLFFTSLCALGGAFAHLNYDIGGWNTALQFFLNLWWIHKINPKRQRWRVIFRMASALCFGASIGPLVNFIIEMDQRAIITIFMSSVVLFGSHLFAMKSNVRNTNFVPTHILWISILYGCFSCIIPHLVYVYLIVLGILVHMKMHSQEAIFLAANNDGEKYYFNATLAFYTEFLARSLSPFIHIVGTMIEKIMGFLRLR